MFNLATSGGLSGVRKVILWFLVVFSVVFMVQVWFVGNLVGLSFDVEIPTVRWTVSNYFTQPTVM